MSLSRDSIGAIQKDLLAFARLYEKERREAETRLQRRMHSLQLRYKALKQPEEKWPAFLRATLGLPSLPPEMSIQEEVKDV